MAERRLGPKDIARLDEEAYEEPGRDLLATKPVDPGEGGAARGDVPNERAETRVPGSMGRTKRVLGSDEVNRLADGKNA